DFHVTGVQTCALPILLFYQRIFGKRENRPERILVERIQVGNNRQAPQQFGDKAEALQVAGVYILQEVLFHVLLQLLVHIEPDGRSEERRVGKECTSAR